MYQFSMISTFRKDIQHRKLFTYKYINECLIIHVGGGNVLTTFEHIYIYIFIFSILQKYCEIQHQYIDTRNFYVESPF